jgi:hypothetical protein
MKPIKNRGKRVIFAAHLIALSGFWQNLCFDFFIGSTINIEQERIYVLYSDIILMPQTKCTPSVKRLRC